MHAGVPIIRKMLALCCGVALSLSSPPRPHIVQIVADDLGYNDLGFLNGGATLTPAIDNALEPEDLPLAPWS